MDPYGNNNVVDKILDGTITLTDLGLTPANIGKTVDALLSSLYRAVTHDGSPNAGINDNIT